MLFLRRWRSIFVLLTLFTTVNSFYTHHVKSHPKVMLTTFDDMLSLKKYSSSGSESDEKPNPLYYVEEKDIARAWASSCFKNAPLYCKRACKKAIDLTCADFSEECTSDFKKTLIEDCKTECRYEFDSTFNYNSYVRPKPHKKSKNGETDNNKNGKDKNGKDKNGNGKDKNDKDKKGKDKDKNGKDEDKNGKDKDKNGKDKGGKDNNGKDDGKKEDAKKEGKDKEPSKDEKKEKDKPEDVTPKDNEKKEE